MTTWRKGMLAVCVNGGPHATHNETKGPWPEEGRVYKISGMAMRLTRGGRLLFLDLVDGPPNALGISTWPAERFRPAVQDWQSEKQSHSITISDLIKEGEPA